MDNFNKLIKDHGTKLVSIIWAARVIHERIRNSADGGNVNATAIEATEGMLLLRRMLEGTLEEFKADVLTPAGLEPGDINYNYYKAMREKVL